MNRNTNLKIIGLVAPSVLLYSCKKYEEPTYEELFNRVQTTFIGFQTGDGSGSFRDTDVKVLPFGDSTLMVVVLFYDSLIVKIESIDFSNGYLVASGDSIDRIDYIDEDETLDIIKDLSKYPLFTFNGKVKD